MACLSVGVRIVLCMTLSVLLIKIVSDRQQFRWRPNELPGSESDVESDKCPDIILGPDPRTDWPTWLPYAKELATEVADADAGEGFDVLFYGDSITEQWRGSSVGTMYPSLVQTHEVFDARFNKNYSSHVLAIAGDQVGHLWWRLLNGDIPVQKHPKAVVVLIGTNDLTADDCLRTEEASMTAVVGIVSRVRQALWLLRSKLPHTHVILLGILPRDAYVLSGPPAYEWPNRMTKPIAQANREYEEMTQADDKMHYLDCGAPFLLPGGGLDGGILPDALHPNADGMDVVAKCLQPQLDNLVLAPSPAVAGAQGI